VAVKGIDGDKGREAQFSEKYSLSLRSMMGSGWSGSGDIGD